MDTYFLLLLAFIINRCLKRDGEGGADTKLRLYIELPVHALHNCLTNAQTESMTVLIFRLVQVVSRFKVGLEQIFEILGRNSDSFVAHPDTDYNRAACCRCAKICCNVDFYRVVRIRELNCVREKIDYDLLKTQLVKLHNQFLVRCVDLKFDILQGGLALQNPSHVYDCFVEWMEFKVGCKCVVVEHVLVEDLFDLREQQFCR